MSETIKPKDTLTASEMATIDAVPNQASETEDMLAERWDELKGLVQERWNELTDDDIEHLSGTTEELAGVLQQRYGFAKAKFEAEIAAWLLEDHLSPGIEDQLPKLPIVG